MRRITILLTKYSDWISTLVHCLAGQEYTHSSLALEEDPDTYYSFNYRGFAVETLEKHRRRGVIKSRCIQLQVSDQAYRRIRQRLHAMQARRGLYRYTRLGLLFCILHLPFRWRHHYFCSQFVAELLKDCGDVPLQTAPCLYLPNRFALDLPRLPACRQVRYNVV